MLTKQEREETAARCKKYVEMNFCKDYTDIFEPLFCSVVAKNSSSTKNCNKILSYIIDLCDMSNMVELPLDKDGEVIRIGDTVYDDNDTKYKVTGYRIFCDRTDVYLTSRTIFVYRSKSANDLTHKKPVTIESLVERIKNALDNVSETTLLPYAELSDIADKLESLVDSNEVSNHGRD